jgi:threonine synthase
VPKAIGDFLILDAVRASGGKALAVSDEAMIRTTKLVGSLEGVFVAPEGAACAAALLELRGAGVIAEAETVVVFNTGSGLKYLECYEQ